jgi:hypothetical protein
MIAGFLGARPDSRNLYVSEVDGKKSILSKMSHFCVAVTAKADRKRSNDSAAVSGTRRRHRQ